MLALFWRARSLIISKEGLISQKVLDERSVEINLTGIVVIVGNYGSAKTEVAINLAVHQKRAGLDVRIADLDLVNPYFRTREAKDSLSKLGIDVVLPPDEFLRADLPILSPLEGETRVAS